jgi:hypothetical protein
MWKDVEERKRCDAASLQVERRCPEICLVASGANTAQSMAEKQRLSESTMRKNIVIDKV